jgi:hypothetical protein
MLKQIMTISLLTIFILFNTHCKRQNGIDITPSEINNSERQDIVEPETQNPEIIPLKIPEGMYFQDRIVSPDGKQLYIYNTETEDTQWGRMYGARVLFFYVRINNILATWNILDLIEGNPYYVWAVTITTTYNNERNSFDMIFSNGYGSYGTAYIDLNTNEFIRELLQLPFMDEQEALLWERQGLPDDYSETNFLE